MNRSDKLSFFSVSIGTCKRALRILFTLFLVTLLFGTVSAHPGKTDSNGGHYDHDTGEYHYHHGYPAHSHTDTDGDGILDCPYDFDDKTEHSSGGNTNPSKASNSSNNVSSQSSQNVNEELSVGFMEYLLLILIIVIVFLYYRIKSLKKDVERNKELYESQIKRKEEIIALLRSDMASLCSFARRHVAFQSQEEFRFYFELYGAADFEIPDDVYFINGYVPVKGCISEKKPFGDFTVYIPAKGACYHSNKFCSSAFNSAAHIYDIAGRYRPCPKCALSILHEPPEWYIDIKRIMENSNKK